MERDTKQQQLLFNKGITNIPSDILCSDNALEDCVGLYYREGENKVIQKPTKKEITIDGTLLYIHKYDNVTRYIFIDETLTTSGYFIKWTDGLKSGNVINVPTLKIKVTSIGKTLIISDYSDNSGRIYYCLWRKESYENFSELPEPEFTFWLKGNNHINDDLYVSNIGDSDGMVTRDGTNFIRVLDKKMEEWKNVVTGLYGKNKEQIAQKKGFCLPFFVRTALELYDGTYTRISNPILLFPCVTENTTGVEGGDWSVSLVTHYSKLYFNQTNANLKDWNDIIKNIVIFASEGIEVHDINVDQPIRTKCSYDYIRSIDGTYTAPLQSNTDWQREFYKHQNADESFDDGLILSPLIRKSKADLDEAIKGVSIFRKLCEIGLEAVTNKNIADYIETHTLENLSTQEYLRTDDYYSRCPLSVQMMYAYNSRLNLANVKRGFFSGFKFFTPSGVVGGSTCMVKIKVDSGDRVVVQGTNANSGAGLYFFYPDSRASVLTIKGVNRTYKLTEHPSLNGAYYFAGIDAVINGTLPSSDTDVEPITGDEIRTPETLPNYIITSEVNNPFVFKAEGYNKVGIGKILGISTTTQALSEGQFGQYPLLVFSSEGVWGMSVNNTGLFSAIHPMSRDVCNNADSITQTDGAVFFTSEKGLMVVVGSQVKCVSEQLTGKTGDTLSIPLGGNFNNFFRNCIIAYDFRDSLLWIFNKNSDTCITFSIANGSFSRTSFLAPKCIVNDYPDSIMQTADNAIYSLIDRKDCNDDTTEYSAEIKTRPMKLENSLALKSIRQIKHLISLSEGAKMSLKIEVSNSIDKWVEVKSLRGKGWKFYRFHFTFEKMKAVDSFSGTVLITQERRTDRLR
jgi:hypothetical protein